MPDPILDQRAEVVAQPIDPMLLAQPHEQRARIVVEALEPLAARGDERGPLIEPDPAALQQALAVVAHQVRRAKAPREIPDDLVPMQPRRRHGHVVVGVGLGTAICVGVGGARRDHMRVGGELALLQRVAAVALPHPLAGLDRVLLRLRVRHVGADHELSVADGP